MSVQKQTVAIQFAGGIETQQDPKQVPVAKLLDLQNGVFERATTIVKRNGYRALGRTIDGGGMSLPTGKALGARGDELLYFSADRCHSYRPGSDTWVDTGAVLSVVATEEALAQTGSEQTVPDHATSQGVTLVAWEDGVIGAEGVYWALVEAATGAVLRPPERASPTGSRPRCLPVGNVLHLVWAETAAQTLQIIVINPTVPRAPAVATSLTTDLDATNPSYDAEFTTRSGTPAIITWARAGGGWRLGYIDASGVLGSAITGHPAVATYVEAITGPLAVTYGTSGTDLAVMTCEGGGASLFGNLIDPGNLSSRIAQLVVYATIPVVRVTACWSRDAVGGVRVCYWAAEVSGARLDLNTVASGLFVNGAAVGPSATTLRGHGLVTRAFRDDAAVYVGLAHDVAFFSYVAVARLSTPIPADAVTASTFPIWTPLDLPLAARLLPIRAYGLSNRGHLASVVSDATDARIHRMTLSAVQQLNVIPSATTPAQFSETGITLASLDFDNSDAWQSAEAGQGLYLAGACPMQYDGLRWAEMGAHTAPDTGIVITPGNHPVDGGGGQLTTGASYLYRFVYESEDAQGQWHRFATSIGNLVEMTGGFTSTNMQIPTLRLTRRGRVRIGVFRSLANGFANLWRMSTIIPSPLFPSYVLNDPTVDFVTLFDGLSDASLVTFEPLYTNGGIVSNDPPPWAGDVIAGGKNRLFWTDPRDPTRVRFSQERAEGFGIETPESLSFVVDEFGGPITALAVMDDALIVFKRDAVYAVGGPGPLANPLIDTQSFSFSPPALIPSDVGCSRASSLGITPVGVLFQSSKGPMVLTRARAVERIGDAVDAFIDEPIVAATLLPDRTQIVMLTAGDRTLMFDYKHGQWSTFSNHAGVDAVVVDGTYYYLRTDGRIFAETPGLYRDDNTQIQRVIETAWIHVAPYLQGWHVFWWAYIIGTYRSAHTLGVQVRMDYESNWGPPLELNVNADYNPAVYGGGVYGDGPYGGPPTQSTRYQKRIHIGKRGQAVQFRFYDLEATADAGAAFDLSELVLEGGVTRQTAMIGAQRSG